MIVHIKSTDMFANVAERKKMIMVIKIAQKLHRKVSRDSALIHIVSLYLSTYNAQNIET